MFCRQKKPGLDLSFRMLQHRPPADEPGGSSLFEVNTLHLSESSSASSAFAASPSIAAAPAHRGPSELAAVVFPPHPRLCCSRERRKGSGGFRRDLILRVSRGASALIESAPLHFISTGGIRGPQRGKEAVLYHKHSRNSRADRQTNKQTDVASLLFPGQIRWKASLGALVWSDQCVAFCNNLCC